MSDSHEGFWSGLCTEAPFSQQDEKDDAVNHPSYYNEGKYEVIDIIKDQLGHEGLSGFCLGNALKYICRSGKKDKTKTVQDLEKAAWYLNYIIEEEKKNGR